MTLQVVGAGLGRTGTMSLKAALEVLLGAPCYHMFELVVHPEHVPVWAAATQDEFVDWAELYDGYAAGVDWPTSAFWPELVDQNPDALVLLSTRDSAQTWWDSAQATIFESMGEPPPPESADWHQMVVAMMAKRFTPEFLQEGPAKRAYEAHNARVRREVPADRLLEWQPGDGWEPICERLGLEVPADPFPHSNSTAEFRERTRRST